ncbi:hypothetical protein BN440_0509 [Erwinia amylovora MR1]|nr:hypothetical protein BN440_0509 [Erwinia amylovora MR1]
MTLAAGGHETGDSRKNTFANQAPSEDSAAKAKKTGR